MPHQCSGITLYLVTRARTHCGTQHLPLKESVSCRLWILGKIQGGGGGGGGGRAGVGPLGGCNDYL